MQNKLRKGMKRLCSMMLAGVLTLTTCVPFVMAEEAKQNPSVYSYRLQVGDIVQPGTEILLEDWQQCGHIVYFDYDESGLDYTGAGSDREAVKGRTLRIFKYALDQNHYYQPYKIESYEEAIAAEPANENCEKQPAKLQTRGFAGWKVICREAETISSMEYGVLMLMAVPADAPHRASVSTKLSAETEDGKNAVVPPGAGITFAGYDARTGEALPYDAQGNLIATPGDMIYACSKPVAGYYSRINIMVGDKPMKEKNSYRIRYWDDTKEPLTIKAMYGSEDHTFLPKEKDAVTVFVMPHTDVTVCADYKATKCTFDVIYRNADMEILKKEPVKVNGVHTVWNPNDPSYSGLSGQTVRFWYKYSYSYSDPSKLVSSGRYYLKNEQICIDSELNFVVRAEQEGACKITNNDPDVFKIYYPNSRGKDAPIVEASSVDLSESAVCAVKWDGIPKGKSLNNDFLMRSNMEYFGRKAISMSEVKPVSFSAEYSEEQPVDKEFKFTDSVVMQGGADKEDKDSCFYRFLYTYLQNAKDIPVNVTRMFGQGYIHIGYAQLSQVMVDLDKDGKWDMSILSHDYSLQSPYDEFRLLSGADECQKGYYEIPCSQCGYGTIKISLPDAYRVEYYDGDTRVYTQRVQKGTALMAPSVNVIVGKAGYTLTGWTSDPTTCAPYDFSKPVTENLKLYALWEKSQKDGNTDADQKNIAVGEVFKDPVSGHTFVVKAVGEKCEVALRKAAVKKDDPNLVVCMGDSLTAGVNCIGAPYPARLAGMCGKKVLNYGVGGVTASYGASTVGSVLAKNPGYVCILYGSNDAICGVDTETTVAHLRSIVAACKAHKSKPILATPPIMRGSHTIYNGGAEDIAIRLRQVAKDEGIDLVDLNAAMEGDPEKYLNMSDGLHFSDAGGDLVAKKFDSKL